MPKPQSKRSSLPNYIKSRGELIASLQALLANDHVDLEILRSGVPWPSATEIVQLSQVSESNEDAPVAACHSSNEPVVVDPALGDDSHQAHIDLDVNWLSNLIPYNGDELSEQPDSSLFCSPPERMSVSDSSNNTDYLSHFSSSSICQWDNLLDSIGSQTFQDTINVLSPHCQDSGVSQPSNLADDTLGQGQPVSTVVQPQHPGSTERDESVSSIASSQESPRKRQRPHYAIEKRYRAGLQERFEALRDCVASLKKTQHEQRLPGTNEDLAEGDDGGSVSDRATVGRMNKAEVLNQATLCIRQLQEENEVVMEVFLGSDVMPTPVESHSLLHSGLTLCGSIISVNQDRRKTSTLGCVIQVRSGFYDLTAAHAVRKSRAYPTLPLNSHTDEGLGAASDGPMTSHVLRNWQNPFIACKNAEAVELDDHSTSEVAVDESVEDVDFVTDVEYEDLREDDDNHGDDSTTSMPNDVFHEDYLTSAPQEGMIETQAMFLSSMNKVYRRLQPVPSFLGGINDNRPYIFWSVIVPELNDKCLVSRRARPNMAHRVTHGDSGSIVIDARTNVVYGHVVASNPLGEIYISPIGATLEQIQSHFPGFKVSLPDPLTLLTGLATFGHETIGRKRARYPDKFRNLGLSPDTEYTRLVTPTANKSLDFSNYPKFHYFHQCSEDSSSNRRVNEVEKSQPANLTLDCNTVELGLRQSTWQQADSPVPLSSVKEESGLGKLARSPAEPAPSRPLPGPSIPVVISQSTGRELYSNGVTEATLSSKLSDEAEADTSIKPDSDAASPTDCRIIGHLRTRPAGLERDLSSTYNAALSKFPSFQNDMIGMDQDPEELLQQDIFHMQVWRSLSTLKQRLPSQERMENLTWRMMHINLRKPKEQEEPK
ncbi:hypothetical protein HG531_002858 [Fusarium graminearum]|nr:hypothetical protein HG531_002858 [Fusarium graminearum]